MKTFDQQRESMTATSKVPEFINADFAVSAIVRVNEQPWLMSPLPGVERRPLDRIGGEVARATTIVRYAAQSSFTPHVHDEGEEYLVLEGVFSDEHGDYPAGTYVRNPPGSHHTPFSNEGGTIFVKLRQMPAGEKARVFIDTSVDTSVGACINTSVDARDQVLYEAPDGGERVLMRSLTEGDELDISQFSGGIEILLLNGALRLIGEDYAAMTWFRYPHGAVPRINSIASSRLWIKHGHLQGMISQDRAENA